jgi:succinate-semialdehyde dehydrogenase/glutarate-semialdehyde dehydrogenase
MAYKSVNPYNGNVLKTVDDITDEQLEAAVGRAAKTYEENWRLKDISYRGSVLKRAAAILRERLDEFARPITLEMDKLWAESQDVGRA